MYSNVESDSLFESFSANIQTVFSKQLLSESNNIFLKSFNEWRSCRI